MKSSAYSGARTDIVPYAKELVSWPDAGCQPVAVGSCLSRADQEWFGDWRTHLLRDTAEAEALIADCGIRRSYCDPGLTRRPKTYGDFLLRLNACGMVRWTLQRHHRSTLGVFFVRKKGGKQRLILDTRLINLWFREPPSTRLSTAGAMSRVEYQGDGELYLASADIECAFYHLRVPEAFSDYFSLPEIKA